jgi:DNA-binding NarL/FixJ family response regulator
MRIVIGEDETLLREGLRQLLANTGGFDIVAAASNATDLLSLTREHRPDLVITDIRMPPTNTNDGLLAAVTIRQEMSGTAVVVLTQHLQRRNAIQLLENGSDGLGYLLKQRIGDVRTFCADLHHVAEGGTVLDPDVVEIIVARARAQNQELGRLTKRQVEVLALMAEGRSNEAIARILFVTPKTVVKHVSDIYDALRLTESGDENRRVMAVIQYLST